MKILLLALFLAATLMTQGTLVAQPTGLNVDDRVRVTTLISGARVMLAGTVLPSSFDSLNIEMAARRFSFALADVHRVEASRGLRGNGLNGALVGAGVGGLVLGGLAAASESGCSSGGFNICFGVPTAFALAGGVGALLGGLAGAVIGDNVRTDRWVEIPVGANASTRPSVWLGPNGLTFTLSLDGRRR